MKNPIGILLSIAIIAICAGLAGLYLDTKEEDTYSDIMANEVVMVEAVQKQIQGSLTEDRTKPPPGWVIMSNGDEYVYKNSNGYISHNWPKKSYAKAVRWAWVVWDDAHKIEPVWVEVTQ